MPRSPKHLLHNVQRADDRIATLEYSARNLGIRQQPGRDQLAIGGAENVIKENVDTCKENVDAKIVRKRIMWTPTDFPFLLLSLMRIWLLQFELSVPETQPGRDALALAERGDLGGMSFASTVPKNGERWTGRKRDG